MTSLDDWRCPSCGCHSYARMDERQADGSFAPGNAIRCVNCKRDFTDALPAAASGNEELQALVDELDALHGWPSNVFRSRVDRAWPKLRDALRARLALSHSLATLASEVERLSKALRDEAATSGRLRQRAKAAEFRAEALAAQVAEREAERDKALGDLDVQREMYRIARAWAGQLEERVEALTTQEIEPEAIRKRLADVIEKQAAEFPANGLVHLSAEEWRRVVDALRDSTFTAGVAAGIGRAKEVAEEELNLSAAQTGLKGDAASVRAGQVGASKRIVARIAALDPASAQPGIGREMVARPLSEWSEDIGDVLWWKFPVEEAPYVGSPNDLGFDTTVVMHDALGKQVGEMRVNIGGWPGYHTHWTPMVPAPPPPPPAVIETME